MVNQLQQTTASLLPVVLLRHGLGFFQSVLSLEKKRRQYGERQLAVNKLTEQARKRTPCRDRRDLKTNYPIVIVVTRRTADDVNSGDGVAMVKKLGRQETGTHASRLACWFAS